MAASLSGKATNCRIPEAYGRELKGWEKNRMCSRYINAVFPASSCSSRHTPSHVVRLALDHPQFKTNAAQSPIRRVKRILALLQVRCTWHEQLTTARERYWYAGSEASPPFAVTSHHLLSGAAILSASCTSWQACVHFACERQNYFSTLMSLSSYGCSEGCLRSSAS